MFRNIFYWGRVAKTKGSRTEGSTVREKDDVVRIFDQVCHRKEMAGNGGTADEGFEGRSANSYEEKEKGRKTCIRERAKKRSQKGNLYTIRGNLLHRSLSLEGRESL